MGAHITIHRKQQIYEDIWIVKGELLQYPKHMKEDVFLGHFCYKGHKSSNLKYMHFLEIAT